MSHVNGFGFIKPHVLIEQSGGTISAFPWTRYSLAGIVPPLASVAIIDIVGTQGGPDDTGGISDVSIIEARGFQGGPEVVVWGCRASGSADATAVGTQAFVPIDADHGIELRLTNDMGSGTAVTAHLRVRVIGYYDGG